MSKRVSIIFSALAIVFIAMQFNANGTVVYKCFAAPNTVNGSSTMDWNGASETFTTQVICDVVEYQWVLNEGTLWQVSQTTTTNSVIIGPCDFILTHPSATDCCGTWSVSVRAKVNNGVDPVYWTAYASKTVDVINCP